MADLQIKINIKQSGLSNLTKVSEKIKEISDNLNSGVFSKISQDITKANNNLEVFNKSLSQTENSLNRIDKKSNQFLEKLQARFGKFKSFELQDIFGKNLVFDKISIEEPIKRIEKSTGELNKNLKEILKIIKKLTSGFRDFTKNAATGFDKIGLKAAATLGIGSALALNFDKIILGDMKGLQNNISNFFRSSTQSLFSFFSDAINFRNSLIVRALEKWDSLQRLVMSGGFQLLDIYKNLGVVVGLGVGGLGTTIGLFRAIKFSVSGLVPIFNVIRGRGFQQLGILQRVQRIIALIDDSLNRTFATILPLLRTTGGLLLSAVISPLMGLPTIVSGISDLVSRLLRKAVVNVKALFRVPGARLVLSVNKLRDVLFQIVPALQNIGASIANVQKRVSAFTSGDLKRFGDGAKSILRLKLPFAAQFQVAVAEIKVFIKELTANIKTLTRLIGNSLGFTKSQFSEVLQSSRDEVGKLEKKSFALGDKIMDGITKGAPRLKGRLKAIRETIFSTLSKIPIPGLRSSLAFLETGGIKKAFGLQRKKKPSFNQDELDRQSRVGQILKKSRKPIKDIENITNNIRKPLKDIRNLVSKIVNEITKVKEVTAVVKKSPLKITTPNIIKNLDDVIQRLTTLKGTGNNIQIFKDIGLGRKNQVKFATSVQAGLVNLFGAFHTGKVTEGLKNRLQEIEAFITGIVSKFGKLKSKDFQVFIENFRKLENIPIGIIARSNDDLAKSLQNIKSRVEKFSGIQLDGKAIEQARRAGKNLTTAFNESLADPKTKTEAQVLFSDFLKAIIQFLPSNKVAVKGPLRNLPKSGQEINKTIAIGMSTSTDLIEKASLKSATAIADFFMQSPPKKGPLLKVLRNIGTLPSMLSTGLFRSSGKVKKGARKVAQTIADYFPQSPPRLGPLIGIPSAGGKIVQFINDGLQSGVSLLSNTSNSLASAIISELNKATDQLFFAKRVGDSVENLSVLRGAIRDTGVDVQDLDFVISNVFNRRLSFDQIQSLEEFGVNLQEIKNSASPSIELFRKLAEGVKRFGLGTDITNKALEAAGIIQTSQLIPALETLSTDIDGLIQKQIDLGLSTSSVFTQNAKDLNVTISRFTRLKDVLKESFLQGFIDDLNKASNKVLSFVEDNRNRIQTVVEFMGKLVGSGITLVTKLADFAMKKPSEALDVLIKSSASVGRLVVDTASNIISILGDEILDFLKRIGFMVLSTATLLGKKVVEIALESLKNATKKASDPLGDFFADTLVSIGLLDQASVKAGRQVEKNIKKATKGSSTSIVSGIFKDVQKLVDENSDDLGNSGKSLADKFFGSDFINAQNATLDKFKKNIGDAFSDPNLKSIIDDFKDSVKLDFSNTGNEVEEKVNKIKESLSSFKASASNIFPGLGGFSGSNKILEDQKKASEVIERIRSRLSGTSDIKEKFKKELRELENKHRNELQILKAHNATKAQISNVEANQTLELARLKSKQEIDIRKAMLTTGGLQLQKIQLEMRKRVTNDEKAEQDLQLVNLEIKHQQELIKLQEFLKNKTEIEKKAALDRAKELQSQEKKDLLSDQAQQGQGGGFLDNFFQKGSLDLKPTLEMTKNVEKLNKLGETTASVFGGLGQVFSDMFEQSGRKLKAFLALQKGMSISQAIINVAVGVTKALSTLPPPLSYIQAASVAAAGGVQIAKISAQGFSEGGRVTQGSGLRDDVPALLKRDEFVLKPSAVSALGINFLESVNNLKTPKVLPSIVTGGKSLPNVANSFIDARKLKDGGLASPNSVRDTLQKQPGFGATPQTPEINLTNVNFTDRTELKKFMASSEATDIILNDMRRRKNKYKAALN